MSDKNAESEIEHTVYLKEYERNLSFAMDTWTSSNHKAFVAITVHFEVDGASTCILLDLIKVAEFHSGLNLATVFTQTLNDFEIS